MACYSSVAFSFCRESTIKYFKIFCSFFERQPIRSGREREKVNVIFPHISSVPLCERDVENIYTRIPACEPFYKNKKKKGRKSEKKKEKIETENPIKIIDSMFAEGCLRVEDEIWKIGTAKRKSASHYRAFLVAHNISLAFFFFFHRDELVPKSENL